MGNDMPRCVWPEWEFVKRIGRGAYGTVYEAVRTDDYGVESRAAIKVISIPQDEAELDSLRTDGMDYDASKTYMRQIVDSFVNEVKLMIQLKGAPNIVSVEDYKVVEREEEIGWDISIRMELLTPLATYISDKAITEKKVAKIGCDICAALEVCEKKNIIHRDIKPGNIFVNEFGDFKLGDFGIAKQMECLTMDLSRKGTGAYMAPEVEKGESYNATVDLYSLGLVLYYLLNKKRLPFNDPDKQLLTPNERERAIRRRLDGETLPAPCGASPEMTGIIRCACAYNPRQRFRSAKDMRNALQLFIKGEVDFSEPKKPVDSDLSGGTDKKEGKRRKFILPVTIIVVVVVVVLAIVFGTRSSREINLNDHNTVEGVDPSDATTVSEESVQEMLETFDHITAYMLMAYNSGNTDDSDEILNYSEILPGEAYALAGVALGNSDLVETDQYSESDTVLPEDLYQQYIDNLFGSEFSLDQFVPYESLWGTVVEKRSDGEYVLVLSEEFGNFDTNVVIENISDTPNENGDFSAFVRYEVVNFDEGWIGQYYMQVLLRPDENSEYGCVIVGMVPETKSSGEAKATAEYSIENQRALASDSKGYTVVAAEYDQVVRKGDDEANQKINASLEQDCQEFLYKWVYSVDEETIEAFSADDLQEISDAKPEVVYNKNAVFSVLYTTESYMSGTSDSVTTEYGLTYSLETGEQQQITDLTSMDDADLLKKIKSALLETEQSEGYFDEAEEEINTLTLNDIGNVDSGLNLQFIVEGGEIVIIVPQGVLGPYPSGSFKIPTAVYIDTMSYDEYSVDYMFPDSDTRYLTREDLEGLSQEELRLARNEIFARHGRIFKDENLNAYFNARSWYKGTVDEEDFDMSVFNDYESENLDMLNAYEEEMGYQ